MGLNGGNITHAQKSQMNCYETKLHSQYSTRNTLRVHFKCSIHCTSWYPCPRLVRGVWERHARTYVLRVLGCLINWDVVNIVVLKHKQMLTLDFKLIEEMYNRCVPLDQVLPMAWDFQDHLGKDAANEFIFTTRYLNN